MKIALIAITLMATQAFAYADKTYECRNVDGLPKNTYKIQSIMPAPGVSLPYVEIHRFFHATPGDVHSKIIEASMRGYATVIQIEPGRTSLQIAALKLEFQGDTLLNCRE